MFEIYYRDFNLLLAYSETTGVVLGVEESALTALVLVKRH